MDEDGRNFRPKQVELIEIINKPLLLHLVGYLYYWQMGFNSVFKELRSGLFKEQFSKKYTSSRRQKEFYLVHKLNNFSKTTTTEQN